jgi:hypothetical protein
MRAIVPPGGRAITSSKQVPRVLKTICMMENKCDVTNVARYELYFPKNGRQHLLQTHEGAFIESSEKGLIRCVHVDLIL